VAGNLISSMMLATDRVCPKERQAELVDVELARNFVHSNRRNLSTLYIIRRAIYQEILVDIANKQVKKLLLEFVIMGFGFA
jgi:hypothetical protein